MGKATNSKEKEAYQLKITLNHITPPIWRRVIVPSDLLLPDFHKVIQTTMGWMNAHLHQFIKGGQIYAEPDAESGLPCIDYRKVKLNQVISKEKETMVYEYDFGDDWEHKIILEKIIKTQEPTYPHCVAGRRECPPENCGGPFGYMDMLISIKDPGDEDHEAIMEWLGEEFDAEFFDLDEINEMLTDEDYGCIIFD